MTRRLGEQTVLVLKALKDGAKYGFEVVQQTGTHTATVYRSLRRLEKLGYVQSEWEAPSVMETEGRPRRRYYKVTRHGTSALAEAIQRMRRITEPQTSTGGELTVAKGDPR